jgi:hypothetical protein
MTVFLAWTSAPVPSDLAGPSEAEGSATRHPDLAPRPSAWMSEGFLPASLDPRRVAAVGGGGRG